MTAIDHLQTETKFLNVHEHFCMFFAEDLATCLQPDHASFQTVRADSGPRSKKHTLQIAYMERVEDLLADGCIRDVKLGRKEIPTGAVRMAIGKKRTNRVLGTTPPEINIEEVDLKSGERTTLAQISPGFCSTLKDFQNRIELSLSPLCPLCRQAEHIA